MGGGFYIPEIALGYGDLRLDLRKGPRPRSALFLVHELLALSFTDPLAKAPILILE